MVFVPPVMSYPLRHSPEISLSRYILITFSTSVRILSVILDQELSFSKHLSSLSRSCFYQLRQLRVIARSLSTSSASTLIHAFVCSRLDYCSSLYTGLPQVHLSSIERVLRSAGRLVGSIPRYGSVSSYMHHTLHWLPLRHRFLYRLCSLVWQCVLGSAPRYLRSIFTLYILFSHRSLSPPFLFYG